MALIDKLTAIGDAIRTKTGKSDTLTLEQMATEIEGIEMTEELPKAEEAIFGIDSNVGYGILSEGNTKTSIANNFVTLGWTFTAVEAFTIVGFRDKLTNGNKTIKLWDSSGNLVTSLFSYENATDGWISHYLDVPINVAIGETYTITVYAYNPSGPTKSDTVFNAKLTGIDVRYTAKDKFPTDSGYTAYLAFVDIIIAPVSAELPDDYQITRTTMDDIAEEVQRITGATGKLSTAQIVTALQGINTSLQSKTVTPTNESQTVTADSGYYGLSSVTVEEISEDNEHVAEIINEKMEVVVNDTY